MNRLDKGASAGVVESTKSHITRLDTEIAQLEKEYQEASKESARLAQGAMSRAATLWDLVVARDSCGFLAKFLSALGLLQA